MEIESLTRKQISENMNTMAEKEAARIIAHQILELVGQRACIHFHIHSIILNAIDLKCLDLKIS